MALHLIPDDGQPHAPTTECGCGPVVVAYRLTDGSWREAFRHPAADTPPHPDPATALVLVDE